MDSLNNHKLCKFDRVEKINQINQQDYQILKLLADGHYHSGEDIAKYFNATRAAICKKISKINQYLFQHQVTNLYISSVTGKGYCLNRVFDSIDEQIILNNINHNIQLAFEPVTQSTNDYVLNKKLEHDCFYVALAEHQLKGRGRVGILNKASESQVKNWYSPFGNNIYMTIGTNYLGSQYSLLGFSLLVGIVIAEVIEEYIEDTILIGLKWPNDIYIDNKKVAGILTEIQGDPNGFCKLVTGIGLNIHPVANKDIINQLISQPWCSLHEYVNNNLSRNIIISKIIEKFIDYYQTFKSAGLKQFSDKWSKFDILVGKNIVIDNAGMKRQGIAKGIDGNGALKVNINGEDQLFHSGEVVVRAI